MLVFFFPSRFLFSLLQVIGFFAFSSTMLNRALLRKTVFARAAIDLCDKKTMPRGEFLGLLTNGKYTPPQFRMTKNEASDYLGALKQSGMVVEVGDFIYADPQSVVDAVHLKVGLPLVSSLSHDLECSRRTVAQALAAAHEASSPMVRKAVRREKEFWAFTALGSGIQMLVLSYLTFQVYGWDVMEPITFFVTTATALCSYAYFLYFRSEHTYEHVDDSLLPYRLSKELSNSQAAAEKMVRDLRLSRELDEVVSERDRRVAMLIADAVKK